MKTLIEISALLGIPVSEIEEAMDPNLTQKTWDDYYNAPEGSEAQATALEKLNKGGLIRKVHNSFGPDSETTHH